MVTRDVLADELKLTYRFVLDGDELGAAVADLRVNTHLVSVLKQMYYYIAPVTTQFPLWRCRRIQN